jgi:uncharacterized membrane protein
MPLTEKPSISPTFTYQFLHHFFKELFLIPIPMIGVLVLILYVIPRDTGGQKAVAEGKTAMDILKERYAKGEITSEQFRSMSEDLRK